MLPSDQRGPSGSLRNSSSPSVASASSRRTRWVEQQTEITLPTLEQDDASSEQDPGSEESGDEDFELISSSDFNAEDSRKAVRYKAVNAVTELADVPALNHRPLRSNTRVSDEDDSTDNDTREVLVKAVKAHILTKDAFPSRRAIRVVVDEVHQKWQPGSSISKKMLSNVCCKPSISLCAVSCLSSTVNFRAQVYHDGTSVFRSYLLRRVKAQKVAIFGLGDVVPSAWDATLRDIVREQRHVFRDVDCTGTSPKRRGPMLSPMLENGLLLVLMASRRSYCDKYDIKSISPEIAALMLTLVSYNVGCVILAAQNLNIDVPTYLSWTSAVFRQTSAQLPAPKSTKNI